MTEDEKKYQKAFVLFFFLSSRRRHTRCYRDWSSDVCSSDLDVATDSVLGQFPIRDRKTKPVRVAFTPDGQLAYVTEGAAASVSVIDVATRTVIDTRSEERRVGKECRYRRTRADQKKNRKDTE